MGGWRVALLRDRVLGAGFSGHAEALVAFGAARGA
jgi:hypothetical protein